MLQGGGKLTLEWILAQVGQTGNNLMSSGGNCKPRPSTAGASITEQRGSVAAADLMYRYTFLSLSGSLQVVYWQHGVCSGPLSVGETLSHAWLQQYASVLCFCQDLQDTPVYSLLQTTSQTLWHSHLDAGGTEPQVCRLAQQHLCGSVKAACAAPTLQA